MGSAVSAGAAACKGSSPEAVTTTSLTGAVPASRGGLLDLPHYVHALHHGAEHHVAAVQPRRRSGGDENCDPLVLGPALAMESTPGPTCASLSRGNASSGNFLP